MEIDNIEQEEIKPLIFTYLFHFVIFILIFVVHLVIYNKIYWISNIFSKIFLFSSYFGIIYFIYPIIPTFIILFKHFKLKAIKIFKIASLILLIISLIFGILISIIILINTINSKIFCQECPFSISLSHLNYIFNSYYGKAPNEDEIEDKCKNRICILDSTNLNDEYPYKYICNYDPSYDFTKKETYKRKLPDGTEISTKNQLICSSINENYKEISLNNELYDYLELCYYLSEFYYCERFNLPKKTYELNFGSICPDTSYLFLLYILCILIIIIDIVISLLPWGAELISLKRIIQLLSNDRRKPNSHNSTAKSSAASNNEESFKKEKTLVVVSPINNEDDLFQVNHNKLCMKESSNDILNDNQDENEKNKDNTQPINLMLNSEVSELKSNLKNKNNNNLFNINSINLFNRNKNKKEIKITNDLHIIQNQNNINTENKFDEDKKK